MQCERLIKQIKSWYIHVNNETMAPARMVSFMESHAAECPVCQSDPEVLDEIKKITELVLPESKIPKAVRLQQEQEDIADEADEDEEYSDDDDDDSDDDMDDDDDFNDDDDDDL